MMLNECSFSKAHLFTVQLDIWGCQDLLWPVGCLSHGDSNRRMIVTKRQDDLAAARPQVFL